jgi:protein-S-isoprenylcysteine O-methyltransferase Ste14
MEVALFLWLTAAATLVFPFLDIIPRTFGAKPWLERATRQRLVLGAVEVATIAAWFLVRGRWRFLPEQDTAVALAGGALALTGAAFAAWAKLRLGRFFSPQLGVQEQHALVTTGPYAVVRHPIYLGLIDFILGSALFFNDVALLAVALLFVLYFRVQLTIEERMFERHFGEEWRRYRASTPALFPRIIRRQTPG